MSGVFVYLCVTDVNPVRCLPSLVTSWNCVCGLSKLNCLAFAYLFIFLFVWKCCVLSQTLHMHVVFESRTLWLNVAFASWPLWMAVQKKNEKEEEEKKAIYLMGRFHFLFHSTQTSSTLTNAIFFHPPSPSFPASSCQLLALSELAPLFVIHRY